MLLRVLILLIVFTLSIQNTCPYGLAAKTGFASPRMHLCPCAKKAAEQSQAAEKTSKRVFLATGPSFVFIGQERTFSYLPHVSLGVCAAFSEDLYQSISLNPPEKPPRFS
jgi:hypothetical protein